MNEQDLRTYVRQVLRESLRAPKGEWILLDRGDPRRQVIQNQLFAMVNQTYAPIGGHFKIQEPASLDRYRYWVVADLDADPDADVLIFGKPDNLGNKMGGAANDGSKAAKDAYKNKSAEMRKKGGGIDGVSNWWGEVSGKPAFALLSRGAPAVESEELVSKLLDGDNFIWHGDHPDPNAPALFKSKKGWYTKSFADHSSTKIILGTPAGQ